MATAVTGEQGAAPLANGSQSSPPTNGDAITVADPQKRKRDEDIEISFPRQTQADILALLKERDTEPSFLNHTLADKTATQKKPKLEGAQPDAEDIATKLGEARYASLSQLVEDAGKVREQLVAAARAKQKDDTSLVDKDLIDNLKQIQRVQAFEDLIKNLVEQEKKYASLKDEREPADASDSATRTLSDASAGTVLTLYGLAPTPKQLFSSAQMPQQLKQTIKSELLIEELGLPPGIFATKVISGPTAETKKRTFEDAFAPAYNLPALTLPKVSKKSAARDSTLTWEFKDPIQRNKKGGFTVQSLSTGAWVSYGGADTSLQPQSLQEKRKQRDRALSVGDDPQVSKAAQQEALAKEEAALFTRAYSSFAPAKDNHRSLVPEETKSMVWWHTVGDRRFDETFALDPALSGEIATNVDDIFLDKDNEPVEDTALFEKIVDDLEELSQNVPYPALSKSKTDIDDVLREISELIEKLASYQRIRGSVLPTTTTARTASTPAPAVVDPNVPSDAEVETYQRVKRELAYLLLQLPPYVVAKKYGSQLADLGVSRVVPFETANIKGTMEEDQVARQAKLAALTAAAIPQSTPRPSSSAGQHYNTTSQRTPAIGQAANTRYGQQYAPRTPAATPQYQQRPGTYATPGTAAPRSGWTQQSQQQYTRPGNYMQQPNGQSQPQQQYYSRPPSQPITSYAAYKSYQPQQSQPQTPQPQQAAARQSYTPAASQYPPKATTLTAAANAVAYQQQQQQSVSRPSSALQQSTSAQSGYKPPSQQPAQAQIEVSKTPQPATAVNGAASTSAPAAAAAAAAVAAGEQTGTNPSSAPAPAPIAATASAAIPAPAAPPMTTTTNGHT